MPEVPNIGRAPLGINENYGDFPLKLALRSLYSVHTSSLLVSAILNLVVTREG